MWMVSASVGGRPVSVVRWHATCDLTVRLGRVSRLRSPGPVARPYCADHVQELVASNNETHNSRMNR